MITNASGGIVRESDYYPFGGERVIGTPTLDDPHKFAGMYQDSESGLYHTWFRMYSPSLARWLSADPVAGSVANPQSLNRYNYVLNNPTNLVDPFGLWAICFASYACRPHGYGQVCYLISVSCFEFPDGPPAIPSHPGGGALRGIGEHLLGEARAGRITDCEAMARIYAAAFGLFEDQRDAVNALVRTLTERSPYTGVQRGDASSTTVGVYTASGPTFSDTGFQSQFQDNSNQVRHFTAAFAFGFSGVVRTTVPEADARSYLIGREPRSLKDAALNMAGYELGAGVGSGEASIDQTLQSILDSVCQ